MTALPSDANKQRNGIVIGEYEITVSPFNEKDLWISNKGEEGFQVSQSSLEKVIELSRPEDVIYEAIGHCYDKLRNYAQARFYYRKASHLNSTDGHLYFKIAGTYMSEGYWDSAVKNIETAMRINKSKPDYHFALAKCYVHLDRIKDAVIHFSSFIRLQLFKCISYFMIYLFIIY